MNRKRKFLNLYLELSSRIAASVSSALRSLYPTATTLPELLAPLVALSRRSVSLELGVFLPFLPSKDDALVALVAQDPKSHLIEVRLWRMVQCA